MSSLKIIDTFPSFVKVWDKLDSKTIPRIEAAWESGYMSQYPELLQLQLKNYSGEKHDWRKIARNKVFPLLDNRIGPMKEARTNLQCIAGTVYTQAQQRLGLDSDVVFVVYVGIGCGAGWVTVYQQTPAVLFGLENVVECGWQGQSAITGLAAHELGHVYHQQMRNRQGKKQSSGIWWQLYEEGFAQRCEHQILGHEAWHEAVGIGGPDWLNWCSAHKQWLAKEFLRAEAAGSDAREFFGSWYKLKEHAQCGYYLGCAVIMELERAGMSLAEIAIMDGFTARSKSVLQQFSGNG